jgi:F0F1-type ATP synthase assembly protein I
VRLVRRLIRIFARGQFGAGSCSAKCIDASAQRPLEFKSLLGLVLRPAAPESPPRYPAFRIAGWQLLATAAVAVIGGWAAGWHGVLSGLLGGLINVSAGIVFAVLASLGSPSTAAGTVSAMVRAETAKIALIVLQLWIVLSMYKDVVPGAFFGAFVVTVLVTQAAILIRD